MNRLLAWLLLAALLAGCKAPAPSLDPLFGRATVPPPSPGDAVALAPDNAYYSAAPPSPAAASNGPGRSALAPAVGPLASRPDDARWRSEEAAETPAAGPLPRPRRLRSASPDESPPGDDRSSFLPRPAENETTDIMDLPAGPPVRTASFSEPVAPPPVVRVGRSSVDLARNRYGYEADYARLQGRLEYSEAADRWKLRYIPLDGVMDAYGGSVVLEDSPLLADHPPGSFVIVHGGLQGPADERSYAPLYRLERIEPLSR